MAGQTVALVCFVASVRSALTLRIDPEPENPSSFMTGFGGDAGFPEQKTPWGTHAKPFPGWDFKSLDSRKNSLYKCPHKMKCFGHGGENYCMCGFDRYDDPVVYSFGSNNNFDFEDGVTKIKPHSHIHIFDPTSQPKENSNYAFHGGYGLAYRSGNLSLPHNPQKPRIMVPVKTLPDLMRESGHEVVDFMKIDISGEMEILDALDKDGFDFSRIGALNFEVHLWHPQRDGSHGNCCYGSEDFQHFDQILTKHGFKMYDLQVGGVKKCCRVLAYYNTKFKGRPQA